MKKVPEFNTDAEAEAFVANADLSEYDLSQFKPMRFVIVQEDTALDMRTAQEAQLQRG